MFCEQQRASFNRPIYASRRRLIRKCCALVLFVPVASDASRLLGIGPPQKAALFAVKTTETKMRVISLPELLILTRAQLFAMHTQMLAVLADQTEGSVEHQFILGTLRNIRAALAHKPPSP